MRPWTLVALIIRRKLEIECELYWILENLSNVILRSEVLNENNYFVPLQRCWHVQGLPPCLPRRKRRASGGSVHLALR